MTGDTSWRKEGQRRQAAKAVYVEGSEEKLKYVLGACGAIGVRRESHGGFFCDLGYDLGLRSLFFARMRANLLLLFPRVLYPAHLG